jgi:hypothetical protein
MESTTKIIGLALGIIVLLFGGFWVWNNYFNKTTLITVVGEGNVSVKPQIVTFTVNIINETGTASAAVADNNTLTRNTLLILKGAGIQDADIQTSYVRVLPPGTGFGQTQFQGVNTIDVTLRNLGAFDNLFNQLYATGVQSISNIIFTVDNSRDLEKQAVAEAVKDAQARAKEIAKSQGKSVGNMVSIITGEVGEAGALSGKAAVQGFAGQISSSPSQIEITRQASIVFELK